MEVRCARSRWAQFYVTSTLDLVIDIHMNVFQTLYENPTLSSKVTPNQKIYFSEWQSFLNFYKLQLATWQTRNKKSNFGSVKSNMNYPFFISERCFWENAEIDHAKTNERKSKKVMSDASYEKR